MYFTVIMKDKIKMLEKLNEVEKKYEDLTKKLSDPEIHADPKKYKEYAKAHSEITEVAKKIKEYKEVLKNIEEVKVLMKEESDKEMQDYLQSELSSAETEQEKLENELKEMMITKDPNDKKDIIMEIRAGAGGDEASLFAAGMYKMYSRYADQQGWSMQILSSSPSGLGGFKEIIFEVKGKDVYGHLKYESGVHRVQRVPVTESGGRIHTSTVTVAVLPEVEEVEVDINPTDLRIDIFRSSGPGGQSVNTTDSAVRITHLSTGIMASCQEERSQLQNRERAMKILRARLYEKYLEERRAGIAESRKLQIGTGDRSERIRTYNFPQGRITDHRIGLTIHNLDFVLEGNIEEIIKALALADRTKKMSESSI
ncbi:MAG: peptide chain release factor 1 [Candidatus Oleimmundimicrobium sp.]|nr:peptide chain release factor 1 [Candidatus Oleimmundimicrobium sp.]